MEIESIETNQLIIESINHYAAQILEKKKVTIKSTLDVVYLYPYMSK